MADALDCSRRSRQAAQTRAPFVFLTAAQLVGRATGQQEPTPAAHMPRAVCCRGSFGLWIGAWGEAAHLHRAASPGLHPAPRTIAHRARPLRGRVSAYSVGAPIGLSWLGVARWHTRIGHSSGLARCFGTSGTWTCAGARDST